MSLSTPSRVRLARLPTPFYCLERLSAHLNGPRLWIKRDDLTECASSGNKIRKLEFVLARAREAGCDTLITSGGLQSNHCRATALLGARLGLRVHLVLRDEGAFSEIPDGNLLLDYLAGAEVTILPRPRFLAERDQYVQAISERCRQEGGRPWVIPVGASDGHGVWGYLEAARELKEDFVREGIAPDWLFHATGSGGTQAGLSAGAVLHELPCRVMGMAVCDSEQYFLDKVRADLQHWAEVYDTGVSAAEIPVEVNADWIGPGYARAEEEVFETIRRLAREEGIVLDPVYTGKAFHGMLEEIRAGRFEGCRDLVFVHTGGVFGLMAQAGQLGYRRPSRPATPAGR